jgi:hypothetical protein
MNALTAILYDYCDRHKLTGNAQTLRTSVLFGLPYSLSGTWELVVKEALDQVDWPAIRLQMDFNEEVRANQEANLYGENTQTNPLLKKIV